MHRRPKHHECEQARRDDPPHRAEHPYTRIAVLAIGQMRQRQGIGQRLRGEAYAIEKQIISARNGPNVVDAALVNSSAPAMQ